MTVLKPANAMREPIHSGTRIALGAMRAPIIAPGRTTNGAHEETRLKPSLPSARRRAFELSALARNDARYAAPASIRFLLSGMPGGLLLSRMSTELTASS